MTHLTRKFHLFTVASIQIMPVLLGGVTGVWLATPAAELLGTAMAAALLLRYRRLDIEGDPFIAYRGDFTTKVFPTISGCAIMVKTD